MHASLPSRDRHLPTTSPNSFARPHSLRKRIVESQLRRSLCIEVELVSYDYTRRMREVCVATDLLWMREVGTFSQNPWESSIRRHPSSPPLFRTRRDRPSYAWRARGRIRSIRTSRAVWCRSFGRIGGSPHGRRDVRGLLHVRRQRRLIDRWRDASWELDELRREKWRGMDSGEAKQNSNLARSRISLRRSDLRLRRSLVGIDTFRSRKTSHWLGFRRGRQSREVFQSDWGCIRS